MTDKFRGEYITEDVRSAYTMSTETEVELASNPLLESFVLDMHRTKRLIADLLTQLPTEERKHRLDRLRADLKTTEERYVRYRLCLRR